jgi:sulfate adenylyltransferase subunit 1
LSEASLLRVAAAGSVDDGKSTLIGRLLLDSQQVLDDTLESVSENGDGPNLAHLTDGLRAERERGITIDVAYRYFATPARRFVLADTPGHEEYTRNMVTGASRADVSIVLIDATRGVVSQSRRHLAISAVLHVPHVLVCVNKMDAVGYAESRFDEIARPVEQLVDKLGLVSRRVIPISALEGDNVVERSEQMPWYDGSTVLELLESLPDTPEAEGGVRVPVQWTIERSDGGHDAAGQLARGTLRAGDDVAVFPGGERTTVEAIEVMGERLTQATAPRSVAIRLASGVAAPRGSLLAPPGEPPSATDELTATVCWLSDHAAASDSRWLVRTGVAETRASMEVLSSLDLESLEERPADRLEPNDIGRVLLRLDEPLAFDPYVESRYTGSLILIDENSNATVAALMAEAASG